MIYLANQNSSRLCVTVLAAGVLRSVSTTPVLLKPSTSPRSGKDVVLVDGVRTPFLVSGTE